MSVLNVCKNEVAEGEKYMTVPGHKLSLYRRLTSTSSTTTGSTLTSYSSTPSSLEFFFFRLLDALIFTSAIAITAYGFLTGTLDQQPPLMEASSTSSSPKPMIPLRSNRKQHKKKPSVLLFHPPLPSPLENEDERRKRRTQEWANEQHHHIFPNTENKRHSSPIVLSKVQPPSSPKHVSIKKQRTKSMSELPEQNERLSRLEEQIQSMIEQGQAALTSPTGLGE